MKKFIIAAFAMLAVVVCIAAQRHYSEELKESKAYVEYNIPNVTSGTMSIYNVDRLHAFMPYDVREKTRLAYMDIVSDPRQDFCYSGVRVKRTANTWEFYYGGASVIVRNATDEELSMIFNMPDII